MVAADGAGSDRAARTDRPCQAVAVARAVYLTSLEPESGKSLVAVGVMELLSRQVNRIGYFRPVVAAGSEPDDTIEMFRSHYRLRQSYDESFGVVSDEARSVGTEAEATDLVDQVLSRFARLARRCDVVLVEGTDAIGAGAAFEFTLNARLAANLGAPVVLVVSARDRSPDEIHGTVETAAGTLAGLGASLLGVAVNRVPEGLRGQVEADFADFRGPVWVVGEIPGLDRPTLREIAHGTGAVLLAGDPALLSREVGAVKVAAMTLPHLLDHLEPDCLIVVPGDRADVVLAALTARFSNAYPAPAGLVLTGGLAPDPQILAFANGLEGRAVPMLLSQEDTYHTATALTDVRPRITSGAERKVSLALRYFADHVDVSDVERRLNVARSTAVTPLMFEHRLLERARSDRRHIVLPEGTDDRVLQAADRLLARDVVELTILGRPTAVADRAAVLGLDLGGAQIIDPDDHALRERFAAELYRLRAAKGLNLEAAYDTVGDVSFFGTMMVHLGLVDGMVSGAAHTTAHTVRPALQVIRTEPGVSIVSSVFFMALPDRVLVYGDCAVNPTPDAAQLADIAISSARTALAFGIDPLVALLSYSTGESGSGADVEKVRAATAIVRERAPDLPVEGPIQYDAAVDASVARSKLPGSDVAGRATVFIFPDLNTGNNTYKAVQRTAGAVAVGPVLQGLNKPVNDLSRGARVEDIVNTVVITAIQAQQVAERDRVMGGAG